jgi:hypothetical protein
MSLITELKDSACVYRPYLTASEAAVSPECRFVFEGGSLKWPKVALNDSHGEPLTVQSCTTAERDKSLKRNVNIFWSSNDWRTRFETTTFEIGTVVW